MPEELFPEWALQVYRGIHSDLLAAALGPLSEGPS
jgi:hypothetical protein